MKLAHKGFKGSQVYRAHRESLALKALRGCLAHKALRVTWGLKGPRGSRACPV